MSRMFSPRWENVVPEVTDAQTVDRSTALAWELVLQARHLPCRVRRAPAPEAGPGWVVLVQSWFLERARDEIVLWREENRPAPAAPVLPPPEPGELWPTGLAMLGLLLFFAWYRTPHPALGIYAGDWLAAGSAEARAILAGEWWRLATALTLHGDGPHVVGNVVVGGVFIVLACRVLGSGLAWLLVMASGIGGNLFNALVLGPPHDSIGFSTAVFGAAGVLSGVRIAEGGGTGMVHRAALPVAAGLGILAMLGAGDGDGTTDLGAHLFGFAAGLALGVAGGLLCVRRGRPGRAASAACMALAVGAPVLSWIVAFS